MDDVSGYAELHCHTNFSFLDGASHPEELVDEAARLGLAALAVTDHDGFYGIVRFAVAAQAVGLPTVFGAELTLDSVASDLPGTRSRTVRPRRSRRSTDPSRGAPRRARRGAGRVTPASPGRSARGSSRGRRARRGSRSRRSPTRPGPVSTSPAARASAGNDSWFVLTGCRKGAVPRCAPRRRSRPRRAASSTVWSPRSGATACSSSCGTTATRSTVTATTRSPRSRRVPASTSSPPTTCTTRRRAQRPLATALAAVRARRSLDEIDGWLPAARLAHLRSAAEQHRRFARWPGAVERTVDDRAARAPSTCASPRRISPTSTCPTGHTDMSWLRELTRRGAALPLPVDAPAARAGAAPDRATSSA